MNLPPALHVIVMLTSIVALLAFTQPSVAAYDTITLRIVAPDKRPIPGASVTVDSLPETQTDANGKVGPIPQTGKGIRVRIEPPAADRGNYSGREIRIPYGVVVRVPDGVVEIVLGVPPHPPESPYPVLIPLGGCALPFCPGLLACCEPIPCCEPTLCCEPAPCCDGSSVRGHYPGQPAIGDATVSAHPVGLREANT